MGQFSVKISAPEGQFSVELNTLILARRYDGVFEGDAANLTCCMVVAAMRV